MILVIFSLHYCLASGIVWLPGVYIRQLYALFCSSRLCFMKTWMDFPHSQLSQISFGVIQFLLWFSLSKFPDSEPCLVIYLFFHKMVLLSLWYRTNICVTMFSSHSKVSYNHPHSRHMGMMSLMGGLQLIAGAGWKGLRKS